MDGVGSGGKIQVLVAPRQDDDGRLRSLPRPNFDEYSASGGRSVDSDSRARGGCDVPVADVRWTRSRA